MPKSPLEEGDLAEIARCLDRGDLDQAQALIAMAGENPAYELATSYLVTRLLYMKGRLDADRVRQRLSDLLLRVSPFPEAEALLRSLGGGVPAPAVLERPAAAVPETPPASASPKEPAHAPTTPSLQRVAPALGAAKTEVALPSISAPEEPQQVRRPAVALDGPPTMEIPTAPRLPRGKPAGPPTRPRPLTDPRQRRSSPPSSKRETVITLDPESLPAGGDAAAAWRSRSLGLSPVATSTPPRGSERTRPKPRSGGYSFISAEPAARSTKPASVGSPVPGSIAPQSSAAPALRFEAAAVPLYDRHAGNTEALAAATSELLSQHPLTTWFAPFDRSLYGLSRCSLALTALSQDQRAALGPATIAVYPAYVGETLRHCHRGRWTDDSELAQRSVSVGAFTWNPHEMVSACITGGEPPSLLDRVTPGLAQEGGVAWLVHAPVGPLAALWSGSPRAEDLPVLAERVAGSPWGRLSSRALDGSLDSLPALERLVEPIGRSAAPVRGTEPWLERLCMLLGAYVGEAVRREFGGAWQTREMAPGSIQTLEGYVLKLPSGFDAEPVAAFRERIRAQNGVRLVAYAQALSRK